MAVSWRRRDEEGVVEARVVEVVHRRAEDHAVDVERRQVARDVLLREEVGGAVGHVGGVHVVVEGHVVVAALDAQQEAHQVVHLDRQRGLELEGRDRVQRGQHHRVAVAHLLELEDVEVPRRELRQAPLFTLSSCCSRSSHSSSDAVSTEPRRPCGGRPRAPPPLASPSPPPVGAGGACPARRPSCCCCCCCCLGSLGARICARLPLGALPAAALGPCRGPCRSRRRSADDLVCAPPSRRKALISLERPSVVSRRSPCTAGPR